LIVIIIKIEKRFVVIFDRDHFRMFVFVVFSFETLSLFIYLTS